MRRFFGLSFYAWGIAMYTASLVRPGDDAAVSAIGCLLIALGAWALNEPREIRVVWPAPCSVCGSRTHETGGHGDAAGRRRHVR